MTDDSFITKYKSFIEKIKEDNSHEFVLGTLGYDIEYDYENESVAVELYILFPDNGHTTLTCRKRKFNEILFSWHSEYKEIYGNEARIFQTILIKLLRKI